MSAPVLEERQVAKERTVIREDDLLRDVRPITNRNRCHGDAVTQLEARGRLAVTQFDANHAYNNAGWIKLVSHATTPGEVGLLHRGPT